MHERGEVPTIDYVYDNYYAMDSSSIKKLRKGGKIVIKEIHPENHARLRRSFPDLVSVLILPIDYDAMTEGRQVSPERREDDIHFYQEVDKNAFDIVMYVSKEDTSEDLADIIERKITLFLSSLRDYPPPKDIRDANLSGYELVAPEFTDARRITTRNFHQLTRRFFATHIGRLPANCICAEIGPGTGWLREEVKWPDVRYEAIELCPSMARFLCESRIISADVCAIPVPARYYDFVLASLADPYAHPMAFSEIWRVLKPGGQLILTSPSHVWASGIRDSNSKRRTTFTLSNGGRAEVYSFTHSIGDLTNLLRTCGFSICTLDTAYGRDLPPSTDISPAITEAALRLGTSVSDLAIVDSCVAQRYN
jgi:hypothetical protein